MNIDFEPSKLVNEVKTHLPDLTELQFRRRAHDMGMHGATYLDLVLEHRRGARKAQGQPVDDQGPKLRPVEAQAVKNGAFGVRK